MPTVLIFNGVTVAHEQPLAPADLTPPAQLPWFRRLAARLLGRGLTRLQAQHRDSWFLGHATGQRAPASLRMVCYRRRMCWD